MALKDAVIVEGCFGIYLAKQTKGNIISQDRRLITDNEIIGMFEKVLKRKCLSGECTSIGFTDQSGNAIFEVQTMGELKKSICDEVYKNREEENTKKHHGKTKSTAQNKSNGD